MAILYLGGVSGAGKSSVAEELPKRIPVTVVNGATELMAFLGLSRGDYEGLRKLPDFVKEAGLTDLFRHLALTTDSSTLVVTGHYVKVLNGQVSPSYGPWYGYCDKLVLISSPSRVIFERVLRDERSGVRSGRNLFGGMVSRKEKVGLIERAQVGSGEILNRAAEEFARPRFRIENKEGSLDAAVERVLDIIRGGS